MTMSKVRVQPQPGGTYIMHTTEPKTIIFTFVNVGLFRVNGVDKHVSSYSDLASPYAIADGPFEYQGR